VVFEGVPDKVGGTTEDRGGGAAVDVEEHGLGEGIASELGGSEHRFSASSLLSLHRKERMTPGALIFELTRGRSAAGGDTERCSDMICLTLTFSVPTRKIISLQRTVKIQSAHLLTPQENFSTLISPKYPSLLFSSLP
jgi:hypothetical protein